MKPTHLIEISINNGWKTGTFSLIAFDIYADTNQYGIVFALFGIGIAVMLNKNHGK